MVSRGGALGSCLLLPLYSSRLLRHLHPVHLPRYFFSGVNPAAAGSPTHSAAGTRARITQPPASVVRSTTASPSSGIGGPATAPKASPSPPMMRRPLPGAGVDNNF